MTEEPSERAPVEGRQSLLVIVESVVSTHDLPAGGEITIGRGYGCDVTIDHPSISRRHAVLRLSSPSTLEDTGSVNGTRVRGAAIAPGSPAILDVGEVANLGAAMVVIQQRVRPVHVRPIYTHGFFQARVDEECARGGRFSVLRIHASDARVVEPLLHEAIGASGILGYFAPGEYEALVAENGARVAERIRGLLAEAGVDGARVGVATHLVDDCGAEAILDAASRGARPSVWQARPILASEGEGCPMGPLVRLLERVAPSSLSVLILGETGAGKEVVAETLHRLSTRAGKPFVRLSCAALSESLLESELFGHERGAFTGAQQSKPGLLETAEGGTLFLDEIGELPPSMQSKLLRVVEERKVLRVGGLAPRAIDIRLVSATNRDLEAECATGRFRHDLYFRLNGISVVVPPLRERVGEIARLARGFIAQVCEKWRRPFEPALTNAVLAQLQAYVWPGNIRELRNVMERAVILAGDGPIEPRHLPFEKMAPAATARAVEPPAAAPRPPSEEFQRIIDALRRSAGNQTAAAALLGISRRTLLHRLDEYGLPRPCKGRRRDP
jgi:two-component system, NtrC family, response regulator AtoC